MRDSGLVHALLGIETLEQLAGHPVVGLSWEGFVLESLLSVLPWRSSAFFYRTSAGAEIDLVLEHRDGALWAIEIKRGLSAGSNAASTTPTKTSSRRVPSWPMSAKTVIRSRSSWKPSVCAR